MQITNSKSPSVVRAGPSGNARSNYDDLPFLGGTLGKATDRALCDFLKRTLGDRFDANVGWLRMTEIYADEYHKVASEGARVAVQNWFNANRGE
jgi:hypothetical protein